MISQRQPRRRLWYVTLPHFVHVGEKQIALTKINNIHIWANPVRITDIYIRDRPIIEGKWRICNLMEGFICTRGISDEQLMFSPLLHEFKGKVQNWCSRKPSITVSHKTDYKLTNLTDTKYQSAWKMIQPSEKMVSSLRN